MKLLVINHSKDRVPKKWLERWVKALNKLLARKGHKSLGKRELVTVFTSRKEMRSLNHQFRSKDSVTDVLSFESADPSSIGELVLCLPVIYAQSQRTGLSKRGELGYMIVHGVLHLLGYDHMQPSEEAQMFALQDEIYACLEKSVGLR